MKRLFVTLSLLLGFATSAFASFPASPGTAPVTEYSFLTASGWHSTVLAAGNAYASYQGYTLVSCTSSSCNWTYNSGNSTWYADVASRQTVPTYTCPSGSTLSGSSCTCTAPNVQNAAGNACISADSAACNAAALLDSAAFGNRDIQIPGKISSGFVCMPTDGLPAGSGCSVAFSRTASYQLPSGAWVSEGTYQRPNGGGSCSISAPAADVPPAEPDTCKNGQSGQVNGVTVCVPYYGPTETQKKKVTEKPSVDGPVSETSTTTTVCTGDNSCTSTTTTTTSVNGGPPTSKTESVTEGKAAFCEANKDSAECGKNGSSGTKFSGSCVTGFVGEGDALQKATAEAVNKTNCLLDSGTALDGVKTALTDGTFGPELSKTNRAIGEFDQTNPLGSTCPPDMQISIMSSSITIPLSQACWALQALGYIAVAFTLLYSTIFVVKGF